MPYRRLIAAAAFAMLAAFAWSAAASGPITGGLTAELRKDWTTLSVGSGSKGTDAHLAVANDLSAQLAPRLSAHTHLTYEPVHAPAWNQGPSVQEFYLQYATDRIAMRGGKLGRKLGISWDAAPGPWDAGFVENYEASEQIGGAADISFDAGSAGRHVVTTGTFFADTNVLSRSASTDDSDFPSYALSLRGGGIAAVPNLAYHLAYVSRDVAPKGGAHETAFTAALVYMLQPVGMQVAPIVEWVSFDDRNAESGTETARLTTGIGFIWEGWTLALARTTRQTRTANDPEVEDSLSQMSLSFALESGVGINAGYSYSEKPGLSTDTYGLLVDYAFNF